MSPPSLHKTQFSHSFNSLAWKFALERPNLGSRLMTTQSSIIVIPYQYILLPTAHGVIRIEVLNGAVIHLNTNPCSQCLLNAFMWFTVNL